MPLLLCPSPVARRALVWRHGSHETVIAASRLPVPLNAVRHLFRDHSSDASHGPDDKYHEPHGHHNHHYNHQKAPDLSSDWASLYMGAKLAQWSGLCYNAYDTLPSALQQEGLKLVAYGRTSFTCWYVADGNIDFNHLQRRAVPRQSQQPPSHLQQMHEEEVPSKFFRAGHQVDSRSGASGTTPSSITSPLGVASGVASDALSETLDMAIGPDPRQQLAGGQQGVRYALPHVSTGSHSHVHGHGVEVPKQEFGHGHTHGHGQRPLLQGGGDEDCTGQDSARATAADNVVDALEAAPEASPPLHRRLHSAAAAVAPKTFSRFIFLRGVQWSAPETNALSLSASLAAFWPSPLLPPSEATSSSSSEQLVAHSGVAAMARELLPVLLPYIRDAAASPGSAANLVLAGHSLGGSLAKLLWAMSILQGYSSPAATLCHTFGSPPVLAHIDGGGGARVLRLLRTPPAAAVNWVLEHDPVPRAMLTADPYFAAARRAVPGLSALLSLRGAVLGEGVALSSGRFLYETAGELLLLRWSARGGCEVVPVSEMEAESLLQMALDEALSAPVRSLQYWLDHHHTSYHHDLETAALAAYRRMARSS